jgi:hypothetical protein
MQGSKDMNERFQSFANHTRYDYGLYVLLLMVIAAAVMALIGWLTTGFVILCVALVGFMGKARHYALCVQDRVIRLEMRLRFGRVLPEDLQAASDSLSLRQIIALRFAPDEELPGLVRQVLDGTLKSPSDIKRAVREWQADHLRV